MRPRGTDELIAKLIHRENPSHVVTVWHMERGFCKLPTSSYEDACEIERLLSLDTDTVRTKTELFQGT